MSHAKQLHKPRYFDDSLEISNRTGLPGHGKSEVCQHVHHAVLATVQRVIAQALEEDCTTSLGCARYEHLPWGRGPAHTRRGSYRRALCTQYGGMPDLRVPQRRRGNEALAGQTIARDGRCWGPRRDQHVMGSCLGRSLRDLHASLHGTLGEVRSVSSCHRLGLGLAKHVEACKTTPIEAPPPMLLVDGMGVKMASPTGEMVEDAQGRRRAANRQQQRGVRRALGVGPDGHWASGHWQMAPGEDKAAWEALCKARHAKGLTAHTTKRVVSDGAHGLEPALGAPLSGGPHQRCLFHQSKHLADHLVCADLKRDGALADAQAVRKAKQARKKAMLAEAGQRDAWEMESDMRAQAAVFRAPWAGREPEAVVNFFTDFDQTLSY